MAKNGACSQEFYIHLLRVKKEIKRQNFRKIVLTIFRCIVTGLIITNLIISLKNSKDIRSILEDSIIVENSSISEISDNEKTDTSIQEIEDNKVVESEPNAKEAE